MNHLHGGQLIWYVHNKYKIPVNEIISFANLVSPLHPNISTPPEFIIKSYSERNCTKLKKTIAKINNVKKENIILTNGSTELIYLVTKIFGKKVQLLPPTYSEYEFAINKYKKNLLLTKDYLPVGASLLFICNPNNPTGKLIKKDDLENIVKKHPSKTKIFIDEAYMDFVDPLKSFTMSSKINEFKNIILSQSLTKFYGMPSLRIGWGIASKKSIETIKEYKIPMTISNLALYYAEQFLNDKKYKKNVIKLIENERKRLFKKLNEINWLRTFPTDSNFFLIEIKEKFTSTKLFELLARKGIIIRDCSNIRGLDNRYIRVAIKTREENDLLIEELLNCS